MEAKCKQLIYEILTEIRELIFSEQTKVDARLKPSYFTRNRKMPFPYLLIFMLADFVGSLDSELQAFFSGISREGDLLAEASFSKARNHMNEIPFKKMFEITRDRFIAFEKKEWPLSAHHFVWCGCDGSSIALPNFEFLGNLFGRMVKTSPTARMGLVFDSLNHFIYEGDLAPLSYTERELALEAIKRLKKHIDLSKAVFIFDRGYTDLNFIEDLLNLGTNFILRVREKFNGLQDLDYETVTKVYFRDLPPLRAAKFYLSSNLPETLVTNLFWPSLEELRDLYYLRWPIEIEFYVLKRVLRLEDFNGYTVLSIYQNFWIALTLSNIASIIKLGADDQIQRVRKDKGEKYQYESNLSEIITDLHYRIVKALIEENEEKRMRCVDEMFKLAEDYVVPFRKNREVERKQNRRAFFHFNQKVH